MVQLVLAAMVQLALAVMVRLALPQRASYRCLWVASR